MLITCSRNRLLPHCIYAQPCVASLYLLSEDMAKLDPFDTDRNTDFHPGSPNSVILNGEKLGVRMPGQSPIQHRNMAPMFYTAWAPLSMRCENVEEMANLNVAMSERFNMRHWLRPLPREGRLPVFPHCGKCFASFVLSNAAPPSGQSVAPSM